MARWAIDVPSNQLAKMGYEMTKAGHLKAVSIGAKPTKYVSRSQGHEFNQVADQMNLSKATREQVNVIYLEQQQLELSSCVLGANPMALARAYKEEVISDSQLDLVIKLSEPQLIANQTESKATVPADALRLSRQREIRYRWFQELKRLINY